MSEKNKKKEEKTESVKETEVSKEIKPKKKKKLILALGLLLILALGAGGFFAYKTILAKKHTESVKQEKKLAQKGASVENNEKQENPGEEKKDKSSKDELKKEDSHKDEAKKGGGHEKKDEAKKSETDKKEKIKGTQNFGETFTIPSMNLNLGNPLENSYLSIGVSIEYRGGDTQSAELKQREVQLKDIVISLITSKTKVTLLSDGGKEELRRQIANRINEVTDVPIQSVYFTEFLVE